MNNERVARELVKIAKDLMASDGLTVLVFYPMALESSNALRSARKALESIADAFGGKVVRDFQDKDYDDEADVFIGEVKTDTNDTQALSRKVKRHFNPRSGIKTTITRS